MTKEIYISCWPSDEGAIQFPNSNRWVRKISRSDMLKEIIQTPSPTGDRDCEELKKENEKLKQKAESWGLAMQTIREKNSRISELEKEVERLKGLIERMFPQSDFSKIEGWQQFKENNNL